MLYLADVKIGLYNLLPKEIKKILNFKHVTIDETKSIKALIFLIGHASLISEKNWKFRYTSEW